jgi:hypothetical protein
LWEREGGGLSGDGAAAELSAIGEELGRLAERLASIGMDALREAVTAGETRRPELERRVTRARHAVERAAGILAGAEASEDG